MTNLILFLRSIVWTSTISALLIVASIILVLTSPADFLPLALVLGLAANALATLSKDR
jgi:hypothetical protein